MAAATSLSPERRTERARRAALARTSVDHYIKALVDRAPELTAEQRDRLALLLRDGAA
jgi:hypothetical protein